MSYYAYDANGFVGDVASISGWNDFAQWGVRQGGEIAKLINQGYSESLPVLADELHNAKGVLLASADSVRANLFQLASKASEVLIISDAEDSSL